MTKINNMPELLRHLGFRSYLTGFQYLAESIQLVHDSTESNNVLKNIYQQISDQHHTSASKVRLNIQYAINRNWDKNEDRLFQSVIGRSISRKPTIKELILMIVEYLNE